MDFPFFALSKVPVEKELEFKIGKLSIQIRPSATGIATMYDKEIILYVASLMNQAIQRGEEVDQNFTFTAHDFFRITGVARPSKRDYDRFTDALERLQGTQIKTNIQTGSKIEKGWFSWLSEATAEYAVLPSGEQQLRVVKVRLCPWLHRAIQLDGHIYHYHHDYFRLGTIERRHLRDRALPLRRRRDRVPDGTPVAQGRLDGQPLEVQAASESGRSPRRPARISTLAQRRRSERSTSRYAGPPGVESRHDRRFDAAQPRRRPVFSRLRRLNAAQFGAAECSPACSLEIASRSDTAARLHAALQDRCAIVARKGASTPAIMDDGAPAAPFYTAVLSSGSNDADSGGPGYAPRIVFATRCRRDMCFGSCPMIVEQPN